MKKEAKKTFTIADAFNNKGIKAGHLDEGGITHYFTATLEEAIKAIEKSGLPDCYYEEMEAKYGIKYERPTQK
jgi:hypothetical protein